MSVSKFTPGPWHIIETRSMRGKEQNDFLLANKTPHVHGVLSGPMSNGDLSLITAAPDLIEALCAVTEALECRLEELGLDPSDSPDILQSRKAIAKALQLEEEI